MTAGRRCIGPAADRGRATVTKETTVSSTDRRDTGRETDLLSAEVVWLVLAVTTGAVVAVVAPATFAVLGWLGGRAHPVGGVGNGGGWRWARTPVGAVAPIRSGKARADLAHTALAAPSASLLVWSPSPRTRPGRGS